MRAERDRLDLIIDSVADPILVTDPAGALVMMNAPAERLFTVRRERRRPRTACASGPTTRTSPSFVSNLFFAAEGARRRGEIGLVDPETGHGPARGGDLRQDPLRARRGHRHRHHPPRPHGGDGEARLYEELKQASAQLEEKVREATAELVRPERAAAPAAHRAGAGLRGQVAVPGQHVPRVPHAAERDPRLHEHAAAGRLRRAEPRSRSGTSAAWTPTPGTCSPSSTTSSTSPASRPGRCRCTLSRFALPEPDRRRCWRSWSR